MNNSFMQNPNLNPNMNAYDSRMNTMPQQNYSHMPPQDKPAFFTSPPQQNFNSPEMQGSMQQILSDNIGEYIVAEFLVGTQIITRKQGLLYSVGTSFVVIYDDVNDIFIVCDIFSISFVTFYYPGKRPSFNFNLPAPSNTTNN